MVKTSTSKLVDHVRDLEGKRELYHSDRLEAKGSEERLTNLDGEFRTYHLDVVNLLEESNNLEKEQAALDDYEDWVLTCFNV